MAYMLNASAICEPNTSIRCEQIEKDLRIKEIDDIVLHGRITNCNRTVGIEGAVVKVFRRRANNTLEAIDHTFSGCDGYYLINIPKEQQNRPIVIMASASTCHKPTNCRNSCDTDCEDPTVETDELTE